MSSAARVNELGLGREPSDAGGPGKEEAYWLRQKLDAAVRHLRDIEDYYRMLGGTPNSFNQARADRARQLYEAIIEDFSEGKITRPTQRERLDTFEAALREIAAVPSSSRGTRLAREALQAVEA